MIKIAPDGRDFKTRQPIAAHAEVVTQLNSEAVIGLNTRRYLEAVRKHRGALRPARIGKLVATRIDAWETLLEALAAEGVDNPFPEPANEFDPQPASADEVLARLGLVRRKAGAR